jgi:hypothetical protein
MGNLQIQFRIVPSSQRLAEKQVVLPFAPALKRGI